MTSAPVPPSIDSSNGSDALLGDWEQIRADSDIQYAPVEVTQNQSEMPDWLRDILNALGEFFGAIFEPIGRFLGASWPVTKWVLVALLAAGLLYLLYTIIEPYLIDRKSAPQDDAGWTPQHHEALALLEDADRLASEGRFDEATHLLLQRSVGQISAIHPDWVDPSSTAREIATLPALPENARNAFAIIAKRVERSLFALKRLGADDWQVARAAYADFALQRLNSRA